MGSSNKKNKDKDFISTRSSSSAFKKVFGNLLQTHA